MAAAARFEVLLVLVPAVLFALKKTPFRGVSRGFFFLRRCCRSKCGSSRKPEFLFLTWGWAGS